MCKELGVPFEGFSHESVAVRWWNAYMYYGYKVDPNEDEREWVQLFHALAMNDATGPRFDHPIPDSMAIHPLVDDLSAADRLRNYKKDALPELDGFDGLRSCTHQPSLSQEAENALLSDEALLSTLGALCSEAAEEVFATTISDAVAAHKPGVGIRKALYPIWNEITAVHSSMKSDEWDTKLEDMLNNHLSEMRGALRESRKKARDEGSADGSGGGSNKRKRITSILSEQY